MIVCVDPGHGGHDPGAVSGYAGREKDYALLQSHIFRSLAFVEKAEIETVLTREDDVYVSLSKRAEISNAAQADAFVSFHWNAAGPTASGTLVLCHRESPRGTRLARRVLEYVAPLDGRETGGERVVRLPDASFRTTASGAPFVPTVLSRTKAPAIIVEAGFGTNERDAAFLTDPAYLVAVARATIRALHHWTESEDRA